jgi:hypothetical protein
MIGDLTWSEAADRAREIRRKLEGLSEDMNPRNPYYGLAREVWEEADQLARDCDEQSRNAELARRQAEPPLIRPYLDT